MKKALLFVLSLIVAIESFGQELKKVVINKAQPNSYYLAMEPVGPVKGVLLLMAGYGQSPENIFTDTKLHYVAYQQNILTIGIAAGSKLYADDATLADINTILKDVLKRYKADASKFVFGGFSAGGTIMMRYAELCNQYPEQYPLKPAALFSVDAPLDVFSMWDFFQQSIDDNYSQPAIAEANAVMAMMKADRGIPQDNIAKYAAVSPFSMNKTYGENEKYLVNTPVRSYHEVDINWRITNRGQTVHNSNFEFGAELVKRLLLMGNAKAQFIQSTKQGYRSNGQRHPHSWSIVDEEECIKWIKSII